MLQGDGLRGRSAGGDQLDAVLQVQLRHAARDRGRGVAGGRAVLRVVRDGWFDDLLGQDIDQGRVPARGRAGLSGPDDLLRENVNQGGG